MTHSQLALLRHVLEQVKDGKLPEITNNEKVDLDYMANYFNNLITDIEKGKKQNRKFELGVGEYQQYVLYVEVNK